MADKKTMVVDGLEAQKARSLLATLRPGRGKGRIVTLEILQDSKGLHLLNRTDNVVIDFDLDEFYSALRANGQGRADR